MKLEITYLSVDDLTPYEHNTRSHCEEDVNKIAKSIEKYGFNDPVGIWGEKNIIVEGHGRLMAAKRLGLKEVPCIRLDEMTDDERREYAILHNWTAEQSEWDFEELENEIAELDLEDFELGFDFETVPEVDEFGTDFSLPDGEKPEICQMTFTLHEKQKQLIEYAIECVKDQISETFGNTNVNGNSLYEVIREWAEQRK